MKNRLFSLALAGVLSLSLVLPVGAAGAAASEDQAIQTVNALGIMVGDRTGSMDLSRSVTRAEFVTMALKAMGRQIGQAASSPYPDVPWSHWAAGYVEAGVAAGLVSGYSDGRFRPSSTITLAEGVTIALWPRRLHRGLSHRPAGPVPQPEAGPGCHRPERRQPHDPAGCHVSLL